MMTICGATMKLCPTAWGWHSHPRQRRQTTGRFQPAKGITPIQVLEDTGILEQQTLIAHGTGILPQDVELLTKYANHVGVAHCPKTYMKLGVGLTPIHSLRTGGRHCHWLGETDGAASNNTMDIWESLRLMALTQKQQAAIQK